MKTFRAAIQPTPTPAPTSPRPAAGRCARLVLTLGIGILFAGAPSQELRAQSDDFDDGDDTGWTRYNPFAAVGANIVRWQLTNGAYRILTTAPSPNFADLGPGRAGSLRAEVYTNFYVSVDVVNWNNALPQAAGILARVRNAGLGTTEGYAFTWSRGNPESPTTGTVDISAIQSEAPSDVPTTGESDLHLEPGKSYRFVFLGRGPNLEGRVYELPDTTTPKVVIAGSDSTFEIGGNGLVIYDNSTGGTNVCDVTFDNFISRDIELPALRVQATFPGEWDLTWPGEATSFILQESAELPGSNWTTVPSIDIFLVNGRFTYYLSSTTSPDRRFFRLFRP